MSSRPSILILGAGYTGLSAALDLARWGSKVTILEAEPEVGGLAGTFELSPGCRLEKFYHHWFSSDRAILDFIEELGLGAGISYRTSQTGLYFANSIFRLASPWDLLTFTPLPFVDRVRTGLMALKARRIEDWLPLEDISARDWICRYGGEKGYRVIWEPLLSGKFGPEADHVSAVWFWNKLKLRGSSRDEKGKEQLVYFKGGFGALTEGMRKALEREGVTIRTSTPVTGMTVEDGLVRSVECGDERFEADQVLSTLPLPEFLRLTPDLPQSYRDRHEKIRFLGNVCVVLRLKRSLSDTYWLNVADPSFPFVGIIEHTNFDAKEHYNGEHIAYLSKYLPTSDPMFTMDDESVFEYCLPYVQQIFPEFERSWVVGFRTWRARYSQPVITKHYSKLIPPLETPIRNLRLATMAQIYPEDRGTNYAVRAGRDAAAKMMRALG